MRRFSEAYKKIIQNQKLAVAVLITVGILVFINILPNEFIVDDFDFVVNWPLIQEWDNLPRFFIGYMTPRSQEGIYSPLRTLLFAANYHIWGRNAWGYHVFSLCVHALGIWVVYRLMLLLTGRKDISFVGTLIFAVHPAHVESIAYITATMDTAGLVLLLLSFFYYVRAFGGARAAGILLSPVTLVSNEMDWKAYRASLMFGILAIFTHELALSLPFLIVFYHAFFSPRRGSWRSAFAWTWAFFLMAGAYVCLKYAVLGGINRGGYAFGAPFQTFLVVLKSWALYLGIMVFPLVLSHNRTISPGIFSFDETGFDRQAFLSQSFFDLQVVCAASALFLLILLAFAMYRRKPVISFCVGWFFLSLLPVSQIVPSLVYYGERYLYAGSFGFCCLMGYGVVELFDRLRGRKRIFSVGLFLLFAVWIGFLMVRTVIRNRDYRDQIAYFESAVRASPSSSMMHNALGLVSFERGLFEKAVESFENAAALDPDHPEIYFCMEPAYSALDRFEDSRRALEKAIALDPDNAEAYYNLAGLLTYLGREEEGMAALKNAAAIWIRKGQILEAGEALESFYIFLSQRKGVLGEMSAKDFLN